eukprot:196096-Hanusia_phi.AAC.1
MASRPGPGYPARLAHDRTRYDTPAGVRSRGGGQSFHIRGLVFGHISGRGRGCLLSAPAASLTESVTV